MQLKKNGILFVVVMSNLVLFWSVILHIEYFQYVVGKTNVVEDFHAINYNLTRFNQKYIPTSRANWALYND